MLTALIAFLTDSLKNYLQILDSFKTCKIWDRCQQVAPQIAMRIE